MYDDTLVYTLGTLAPHVPTPKAVIPTKYATLNSKYFNFISSGPPESP